MLLVDHPTSFGGNVLQRPAQVDGIQAKMGEWVCLVFHPTSSPSALARPGGGWLRSAEADRPSWPPRVPRFEGSLWRIRFVGPVFRFGQNPVLCFCFGLEVSDMRVRTVARLYRNKPATAFYHFRFKVGSRLSHCRNMRR